MSDTWYILTIYLSVTHKLNKRVQKRGVIIQEHIAVAIYIYIYVAEHIAATMRSGNSRCRKHQDKIVILKMDPSPNLHTFIENGHHLKFY